MAGLNGNWWVGFPLFLAVLVAYSFLYDTYVVSLERKSLKGICLAFALVLFQIAYWASGFWLASDYLRKVAAS